MGKKTEPVRPLYPTKHEYEASLKNALDAATMLHTAVRSVIQFGDNPKAVIAAIATLKKYSDAYQEAVYGDDS